MPTLNERLAVKAGWKEVSHTTPTLGCIWVGWETPDGIRHDMLPTYTESLDLIRRDLLPLLTEIEQQTSFGDRMWQERQRDVQIGGFCYWLLTAPAATIAEAVAEVLDAE